MSMPPPFCRKGLTTGIDVTPDWGKRRRPLPGGSVPGAVPCPGTTAILFENPPPWVGGPIVWAMAAGVRSWYGYEYQRVSCGSECGQKVQSKRESCRKGKVV